MKNLDIMMEQVGRYIASETVPAVSNDVFVKAQREVQALKEAGIDVEIKQVEQVIVVKPKSRRGGRRTKI